MIIATDATTSSAVTTSSSNEAQRVMDICNACRYCEGLCATFQSMTHYRAFTPADLDHLANLCHNCTACYHDCQYAPPHEFAVNVPKALADLRVASYQRYAWPNVFARLFHNNATVSTLVTGLVLTAVLVISSLMISSETLFSAHQGDFYAVISHGTMVWVASATFGFGTLALLASLLKYWQATALPGKSVTLWHWFTAMRHVASLRYLDGGHGDGCSTSDDRPSKLRRWFHHLTMWGFVLCFLATCVATIYHYALDLPAPYPFLSLPVQLGTIGGLGLIIGPLGLMWLKHRADENTTATSHQGLDYAFLVSLLMISFTGMLVLALRDTAAMPITLLIHLGFVFTFFIQIPFSKFVHGFYRLIALIRFAQQQDPS